MKRCRYSKCREKFAPRFRTTEVCCSDEHAILYARESAPERQERQRQMILRAEKHERREAKAKLRSRRDWVKLAQAEFNRFIRERDDGKPCICCGKFPTSTDAGLRGHLWDAGHYRSVGAAPHLRFNEDNVHRQLVQCNRDKSGNAVEYRRLLIGRIGLQRVEALENDNGIVRFDIAHLKSVIYTYRAKLKELRAQREARAA